MTADPAQPGVAYVVWDQEHHGSGGGIIRQRAYFSKTTDGSRTWSAPKAIAGLGAGQRTINNLILVGPNHHALYDFYSCDCGGRWVLNLVKSTDGGASWSAPHRVARLDSIQVQDPATGASIRTADVLPSIANDPVSGALYVAFQTPRFNGGRYDEIGMVISSDGGATWTHPRRVNTLSGHAAFTPSLAVSRTGVVGLTYYDFRHAAGAATGNLPTDLWLRTSTDHGQAFGPDRHVSGPFDMETAPLAIGGRFIGDYEGLTVAGSTFVPFFVATNCSSGSCHGNRTDVYAAPLRSVFVGRGSRSKRAVEARGRAGADRRASARRGRARRPA